MGSVNLKDVQMKLYEKLKPSGWADKLKTFILSEEFYNILSKLLEERQNGKRFTPTIGELFRAFEECPFDDTKVIMIGQDPYPAADVADGIAFSCSKQETPAASLKFMQREIKSTVYPNAPYDPGTDLKYLANQGVLLLNTGLTTSVNEIGSHMLLWRPFIAFLLDILVFDKKQRIYVFMGTKAKNWAKSIPQPNYKFFTLHPAIAAHAQSEKWDSGDMFNQVSKILREQFQTELKW